MAILAIPHSSGQSLKYGGLKPEPHRRAIVFSRKMIPRDGEGRSEADVQLIAEEQAKAGAERDIRRVARFLKGAQNRVRVGAVLKGMRVEFHGAHDRDG